MAATMSASCGSNRQPEGSPREAIAVKVTPTTISFTSARKSWRGCRSRYTTPATTAMLVRNATILGLLAPLVLMNAAIALVLMITGAAIAIFWRRTHTYNTEYSKAQSWLESSASSPLPALESPFSLTAAFKFGIIFLALDVAGTLAQRALGETGFYVVSAVGGLVSSASAVASAANLSAAGTLSPYIAGNGAVIASAMSAIVNLPLVARLAKDHRLTIKTAGVLGTIFLLGILGCIIQAIYPLPRI